MARHTAKSHKIRKVEILVIQTLIDFLAIKYADEYSILQVGTGDSPLTVPFYEKCGFVRSHNIPNFFTDNYDHPIYECGVQLIDMVYLQRCL